jgi:hypothetical protein
LRLKADPYYLGQFNASLKEKASTIMRQPFLFLGGG